jgi:hypothetical protein
MCLDRLAVGERFASPPVGLPRSLEAARQGSGVSMTCSPAGALCRTPMPCLTLQRVFCRNARVLGTVFKVIQRDAPVGWRCPSRIRPVRVLRCGRNPAVVVSRSPHRKSSFRHLSGGLCLGGQRDFPRDGGRLIWRRQRPGYSRHVGDERTQNQFTWSVWRYRAAVQRPESLHDVCREFGRRRRRY